MDPLDLLAILIPLAYVFAGMLILLLVRALADHARHEHRRRALERRARRRRGWVR